MKIKQTHITYEKVCPICYDNLSDGDGDWCRLGCNGNYHKSCVDEWIKSQIKSLKTPLCPICHHALDLNERVIVAKKRVVERPNLSEQEIHELLRRDITPEDYHLLQRLDQPLSE
jgi:hypothetical protein